MKFRRKKSEQPAAEPLESPATPGSAEAATPDESETNARRKQGPWDISEVELEENDPSRIDLGSLIVPAREGLKVQLQVDEKSGRVAAAMLAGDKGAVELRAFAAPRHADIWDDVRKEIAAEVARRGGTATEAEGPWGTELRVVMNVKLPDGKPGQQPSRVYGIPGPRWMLRATLFGQPALEPVGDGLVESAMRDVIVRRGTEPFAPGEVLPLQVPPDMVSTEEDPPAGGTTT